MRITPVVRFDAFGCRFDLTAPAPLRAVLTDGLADLRVLHDAQRRASPGRQRPIRIHVRARRDRFDVAVDRHVVVRGADEGMAIATVLTCCNEAVSKYAASDWLVLHAGVVAVDGAGVALVGHSGAGKTTLTAAAVRRGHGFVADELGIVDDDLVVHPYHRPLGMRPAAAAALGLPGPASGAERLVRLVPGSALGPLAEAVPLRLVVLLGGDGEPAVAEAVTPARLMFELLNRTIGTEDVEARTFGRLDRMVRAVPAVRIARAAPEAMLDEVERVLPAVRVRE